MASVIAVAALAAAGCGSSSKSKTTAPAAPSTPAATTPATPSTPSTTTTPTNVPASDPVTSSAFRAVVVSQAEHNGAPASKAPEFADCLIKALPGLGIKTAGDFKNNETKAKTAVVACNKSVGVNVKP